LDFDLPTASVRRSSQRATPRAKASVSPFSKTAWPLKIVSDDSHESSSGHGCVIPRQAGPEKRTLFSGSRVCAPDRACLQPVRCILPACIACAILGGRLIPSRRATARPDSPSASNSTTRLLKTSRCGAVRARHQPSSVARSLADSDTESTRRAIGQAISHARRGNRAWRTLWKRR